MILSWEDLRDFFLGFNHGEILRDFCHDLIIGRWKVIPCSVYIYYSTYGKILRKVKVMHDLWPDHVKSPQIDMVQVHRCVGWYYCKNTLLIQVNCNLMWGQTLTSRKSPQIARYGEILREVICKSPPDYCIGKSLLHGKILRKNFDLT
jgi:hypothetical protein